MPSFFYPVFAHANMQKMIGLPEVSQNTPVYNALEDALRSSDPAEVRRVMNRAVADVRDESSQAKRLRLLRMSAFARQPLKSGGRQGRDDQEAFRAWMRADAGRGATLPPVRRE